MLQEYKVHQKKLSWAMNKWEVYLRSWEIALGLPSNCSLWEGLIKLLAELNISKKSVYFLPFGVRIVESTI